MHAKTGALQKLLQLQADLLQCVRALQGVGAVVQRVHRAVLERFLCLSHPLRERLRVQPELHELHEAAHKFAINISLSSTKHHT